MEMTLVAPGGAVPLTGTLYLPIKLVSTKESNNDGALLPTQITNCKPAFYIIVMHAHV